MKLSSCLVGIAVVLSLSPARADQPLEIEEDLRSTQEVVGEILAQDHYAFCHSETYTMSDEVDRWCLEDTEVYAHCPAMGKVCARAAEARVAAAAAEARAAAKRVKRRSRPVSETPRPQRAPVGGPLFYGVLVIFLALAAYLIFKNTSYGPRDPDDETADEISVEAIAEGDDRVPDGDADRLLERASSAAQEKRYEEAISLCHMALLLRLNGGGLIRLDTSRTHGDYLRDLRRQPQTRSDVRTLFRDVEPIFFGGRVATSDRYERVAQRVRAVLSQISSTLICLLCVALCGCGGLHSNDFAPPHAPSGHQALVELGESLNWSLDWHDESLKDLALPDESVDVERNGRHRSLILLGGVVLDDEEWSALLRRAEAGMTLVVATGTYLPTKLGVTYEESPSESPQTLRVYPPPHRSSRSPRMSERSSVENGVADEWKPTTPDAGRLVRTAEGVLEQNVSGQTVIVTPDNQIHIQENATARHLWTCISEAGYGGISEEDLVGSLIANFEVDYATAVTDVSSYLDHLLEVNVFEIIDTRLEGTVPETHLLKVTNPHSRTLLFAGERPYAVQLTGYQDDGGRRSEMRIIVMADDSLFCNAGLAISNNVLLTEHLIVHRVGTRSLLRDGLVSEESSAPTDKMNKLGLTPLLLQLLLLACAFVLWRGVHFGRPHDPLDRRRRDFGDHVRALGAVYGRNRAAGHALNLYGTWVEAQLRRRLLVNARGTQDELAEAASIHSSCSPEEIRTLLRRATGEPESEPRGDELKLLRRLSALYRENRSTK